MTAVADSRTTTAPPWIRGWSFLHFAFGPIGLRCYYGGEYDERGDMHPLCPIYDVDQPGDGSYREMVSKWVVNDPINAPTSDFHCPGCGRRGIEE